MSNYHSPSARRPSRRLVLAPDQYHQTPHRLRSSRMRPGALLARFTPTKYPAALALCSYPPLAHAYGGAQYSAVLCLEAELTSNFSPACNCIVNICHSFLGGNAFAYARLQNACMSWSHVCISLKPQSARFPFVSLTSKQAFNHNVTLACGLATLVVFPSEVSRVEVDFSPYLCLCSTTNLIIIFYCVVADLPASTNTLGHAPYLLCRSYT